MATCRSCDRPIIWARLTRGRWVPLDSDPVPNGQIVLLRDGERAWPINPGEVYPPEVQERRYSDHNTTCPGYKDLRTFVGSLRGAGRSPDHERRERVRALKLLMDRERDAGGSAPGRR